ncbi:hypothetical protein DNTS_021757 [Danionella cerebrum]|uniref:Uncharacterized protein n=1 Tax=Danionella cerebrum TaxID=2873325 RepID=A0A553QNN2_9TELE|nr:hypothetical protein DNTS_021757 [Danionella translucida]
MRPRERRPQTQPSTSPSHGRTRIHRFDKVNLRSVVILSTTGAYLPLQLTKLLIDLLPVRKRFSFLTEVTLHFTPAFKLKRSKGEMEILAVTYAEADTRPQLRSLTDITGDDF